MRDGERGARPPHAHLDGVSLADTRAPIPLADDGTTHRVRSSWDERALSITLTVMPGPVTQWSSLFSASILPAQWSRGDARPTTCSFKPCSQLLSR